MLVALLVLVLVLAVVLTPLTALRRKGARVKRERPQLVVTADAGPGLTPRRRDRRHRLDGRP